MQSAAQPPSPLDRAAHTPSTYQETSPLTNLVRKASARQAREKASNTLQPIITPSRHGQSDFNHNPHSPVSPLLHTHFRNNSTATASTYHERSSYMMEGDPSFPNSWRENDSAYGGAYLGPVGGNGRGSGVADGYVSNRGSASAYSQNSRVQSMASVYSNFDDVVGGYQDDRTSWQPVGAPPDGVRSSYPGRHPIQVQQASSPLTPGFANYNPPTFSPMEGPSPAQSQYSSGRVPSQLPPERRVANFSRPVPPVIDGTEQRKREVLMRNSRSPANFSRHVKHQSTSPSIVPSIRVEEPEPEVPSTGGPYMYSYQGGDHRPNRYSDNAVSPTAPRSPLSGPPLAYGHGSPVSPGRNSPQSTQGIPQAWSSTPVPSPPLPSSSSSPIPPNARSPSPSTMSVNSPSRPSKGKGKDNAYDLSSPDALQNPRTPQDFLQLGISHHMANRLEESARCFEKSATLDNGCGVGMLMWGLALRHGWGVPQNEEKGFKWLRKAAEGAVSDLESTSAGVDSAAVKSELVIAIYEVGQSFFRGWGVDKDKKMGVNYFRVAARLGDMDAQQHLAFALEKGKGCKKDRKEAAMWYRAAVQQGASDVGLAWIHKEKFQ